MEVIGSARTPGRCVYAVRLRLNFTGRASTYPDHAMPETSEVIPEPQHADPSDRQAGRVRHVSRLALRAVPALSAGRRPARGHRRAGRRRAGRRGVPDAAGRDRLGQDLHHGQRDRAPGPAGHRVRAQQDAGGAALQRVPRVLPEERGRVLRQLLRLLPARGLRARSATCSSRRTARSTSTSSRCACRPPRACWSGATR